jgi:hypothetical protein
VNEELASYLEMAEAAAREHGLSAEEARRSARRDLGNLTMTRESVRSEWIPPKLEHLAQDVRHLVRSLRRAPAFACIAIASMALGISAANTVFSLVDGILLKPLAYAQPDQLVYLQEFVPALAHVYPKLPVNLQHFRYWQSHNRSFAEMAALRASRGTLTGAGEPIEVDSVESTHGLFRVLGTTMALGRGFLPEDELPGYRGVAIITDALWRTRFQSDRNITGKRIVFGGAPVEIIGVLPPDFIFPSGNDLGRLAGLGKHVQIFQPIQSPGEKSTTRPSMCTSAIRGKSSALFAFNQRSKPAASATPIMPPSDEKNSASVRICCIRRLRPTPRAARIKNSRTRP